MRVCVVPQKIHCVSDGRIPAVLGDALHGGEVVLALVTLAVVLLGDGKETDKLARGLTGDEPANCKPFAHGDRKILFVREIADGGVQKLGFRLSGKVHVGEEMDVMHFLISFLDKTHFYQ